MPRMRIATAGLVAAAGLAALATPARAELPDAAALLSDLRFTPEQIDAANRGEIVRREDQPASPRELTAAMLFLVEVPPDALVKDLQAGLGTRVQPDLLAAGTFQGGGSPADLAKLTLDPDAAKQAKAYLGAEPGEGLNLSRDEIAAFERLGPNASAAQVLEQVRTALLTRLGAYQSGGLAAIAPYARSGGERQPGEELRIATEANAALAKYAPAARRALLEYPQAKPPGTQEAFQWARFLAHGEPTITLTHALFVPDGDAWVVAQRQFYVSTGYNVEQAVAALLPVKKGTAVIYGNRTSTDQVAGFGGSAKRSIGSKLLASQLETIFQRGRKKIE